MTRATFSSVKFWIGSRYRLVDGPQMVSLNSYWFPLGITAVQMPLELPGSDLNVILLLATNVSMRETCSEIIWI